MDEVKLVPWPGWKIQRKIGSGSYGSVYEIHRDVFGSIDRGALKVISIPHSPGDIQELISEGYNESDITERFRSYLQDITREYSLMASLKGHANIVYCEDIHYTPREEGIGWDIFIKMELLTPLLLALKPGEGEEVAIRLGKDICNALIACRKHNIVHRDIKPQNIFISEAGDYKLGDFGIAKTAEKTTGGTKIGTYKYMAPEVYNNEPYGASADLYSLGMVMYWLLNKRRTPFLPMPPTAPTAGAEEEARRRRFSGEPVPSPVTGSEALKAIVCKAVAFRPEDRFASAEEMLEALNALDHSTVKKVASAPVSPKPEFLSMEQQFPLIDPDDEATTGILSGRKLFDIEETSRTVRKAAPPPTKEHTECSKEERNATPSLWDPIPNLEEKKPSPAPESEKTAASFLSEQSIATETSPILNSAPEEKKDNKKLVISLILIPVILGVVALSIFLGFHLKQKSQYSAVVMTVGDHDVTAAEFNYYFREITNEFSNAFGGYLSPIGFDTGLALDQQNITQNSYILLQMFGYDVAPLADYEQEDGNLDITWAGYFVLLAKEKAAQNLVTYQAAMADPNYEVSEDIQANIDEQIDYVDQTVELYKNLGFNCTEKQLMEDQYGVGCNKENYAEYLRVTYIANDYTANYRFSAEEIAAEYERDPSQYDVVTFSAKSFSASSYAFTEEGDSEEDASAKAEALAKAKAAAEETKANFGIAYVAYIDRTRVSAESFLTKDAATWLFDTAKVGDIEIFYDEASETYFVVKLLANSDDYLTSNLMAICMQEDEENDYEYEEDAESKTATNAEKVEAILTSLKEDSSEENFRTLAATYNKADILDMEDTAYNYVADNFSIDALLWILENRQIGDYAVFEDYNKTSVLYYTGSGNSYRNMVVNSSLVNEWIAELTEAAVANCNFNMDSAMKASISLYLSGYEESDTKSYIFFSQD